MLVLYLIVVIYLLKPSVAWIYNRGGRIFLERSIESRSTSALWGGKKDSDDYEPRVIRNLEELQNLYDSCGRGEEGNVYQMDAALLDAWTGAGDDATLDVDPGGGRGKDAKQENNEKLQDLQEELLGHRPLSNALYVNVS